MHDLAPAKKNTAKRKRTFCLHSQTVIFQQREKWLRRQVRTFYSGFMNLNSMFCDRERILGE